MNIGLKQISVCLLLIAGIANASANAGGNRREERDFMRLFQVQSADAERGSQRNEPQMQQGQVERRRGREYGSQDSSGNGSQVDNSAGNPPEARKQGKLSPEERRALRRQIDEAGHDIYAPKR